MNAHILLSLFHIFAVVPLFLFVALSRASTPSWLYTTLAVLGGILVVYHGFKAVRRFLAKSSALYINLIHALIIAPLLIYIGVKGKETPRPAYEMLAMVAFAALGYHIYYFIVEINTIQDTKE